MMGMESWVVEILGVQFGLPGFYVTMVFSIGTIVLARNGLSWYPSSAPK